MHHTAVAVYGISDELAAAVLEDFERAPIDAKTKAILAVIHKLTVTPDALTRDDVNAARAAGASDLELRDAMYVCFCFNILSRLADALDFPMASRTNQLRTARFLQFMGYSMASLPG